MNKAKLKELSERRLKAIFDLEVLDCYILGGRRPSWLSPKFARGSEEVRKQRNRIWKRINRWTDAENDFRKFHGLELINKSGLAPRKVIGLLKQSYYCIREAYYEQNNTCQELGSWIATPMGMACHSQEES